MKIWHVYASPRMGPVNGVVALMHSLADAQRSMGHDVEVLHGTDDDPLTAPARGSARRLRSEARALGATKPPDVIHLHELFRPPHLMLAPRLRTTPYVVSTHGATSPQNLARYAARKAIYSRVVERHLAGGADALVASTPVEAAELRRWLPDGPPIRVLANVASPSLLAGDAWSPAEAAPDAAVVSLGRFDVRHKGLDRLADVAARVPAAEFVVHGSRCGNEPELLDALVQRAPANLHLADPVTGHAKDAALLDARAFILLSRWEGLSVALLEAMASGIPCVVSPEVAATLGPDAPVLVLATDPDEAASQLDVFLASTADRARIGAAGRRWAATHASPEAVGAASLAIYDEILHAGSSDPTAAAALARG